MYHQYQQQQLQQQQHQQQSMDHARMKEYGTVVNAREVENHMNDNDDDDEEDIDMEGIDAFLGDSIPLIPTSAIDNIEYSTNATAIAAAAAAINANGNQNNYMIPSSTPMSSGFFQPFYHLESSSLSSVGTPSSSLSGTQPTASAAVMGMPTAGGIPAHETLDQMLTRLEYDIQNDKTSSADARKIKAREVARLRRMKKQQEAETLTREIAELLFEYECAQQACDIILSSPLDRKILEEQVSIISNSLDQINRPTYLICQVCGDKFKRDDDIIHHIGNKHSILALKPSADDMDEDETQQQQSNDKTSGNVDKKRQRLEKNALSARLSRQRKKLYVQLLQTQIPLLKARINRIRVCMPAHALKLAIEFAQARQYIEYPAGGLYPFDQVSQLLSAPRKPMPSLKPLDVSSPASSKTEMSSLSEESAIDMKNKSKNQRPIITKYRSSISTNVSNEEELNFTNVKMEM